MDESRRSENKIQPKRLLSLDYFRGVIIILMIIVNTPGSYENLYAPLKHASWNGVTLASLVFPSFLFIVGVSITLSYTRKLETGTPILEFYRRILSRLLKLFILGVFLDFWYHHDTGQLRLTGVLQRIAIVYALCSLLFLHIRWKQQVVVGAAILVMYWALMAWMPVPIDEVNRQALETGKIERAHQVTEIVQIKAFGEKFLCPNLEPATNLAAWLDRSLLPGRLYEKTFDPEGILSTLPALVTGILGMLIGQLLIGIRGKWERLFCIFLIGLVVLSCGRIWGWVFPLNKHLWTSSFVLWTAGLATLFLAGFIFIIDVLEYRRLLSPALVFGSNAIIGFVLSMMLNPIRFISAKGLSINGLSMGILSFFGMSGNLASLFCSTIYVFIVFVPLYLLYRARIFIRL